MNGVSRSGRRLRTTPNRCSETVSASRNNQAETIKKAVKETESVPYVGTFGGDGTRLVSKQFSQDINAEESYGHKASFGGGDMQTFTPAERQAGVSFGPTSTLSNTSMRDSHDKRPASPSSRQN